MSDVWVYIDHTDGETSKVTGQLLTAARTLAKDTGGEAVAVFVGKGWETAKERVSKFGPTRAIIASSEELGGFQTAPSVEILGRLIGEKQPWGVLFASVPSGKVVATRVAARLGAGVLADSTDVKIDGGKPVCEYSAFGGALVVKKTLKEGPFLICVKPNAFVAEEAPSQPEEETADASVSDDAKRVVIKERVQ